MHKKKTKIDEKRIPSGKRLVFLSIAAILLLGGLIYSNSFDCAFQFDDSFVETPAYHDIGNPHAIWNYSPRRFIGNYTLALNYHFNHLTVFGYHLVNLSIHLVNALLVWVLALLILSTPAIRDQKFVRYKHLFALGCSLLFVSHPVQTQAVTYIVQRQASLAALFYFASLIFFLKGRMSASKYGKGLFILSGAAAMMGILTKETVLTLPLMIVLFEFSLFQTVRIHRILSNRKLLYFVIPLLLITLSAPFVLSFDQKNLFGPVHSSRFQDPPLTSGVYLMTQFRVITTYIRLLFLPIHQNVDYDFPASRSIFEIDTFLSFLFLAGLFAFAIRMFRSNRIISLGILWFFLTLSVESSFKPIEDVIFEHRLYLPMFGFTISLIGALASIESERLRKAAVAVLLVFIAANSVLAYSRNEVWKTDLTLWADAVRKSPLKARPHYSLGSIYSRMGNTEKAVEEYQKTLEIEPRYIDALLGLGSISLHAEKYAEAEELYEKAVRVDPHFSGSYVRLANLYRLEKKYEEARALLAKAASLDPSDNSVYSGLGNLYSDQGDFDNAKKSFMEAINRNPDDGASWFSLGNIFIRERDIAKAQTCFLHAVNINRNDGNAISNLGNTYLEEGKYEQAIQCYQRALQLDPGDEITKNNMNNALQRLNQ